MPDKDTILTEQNRTEQNRTEQNRTEQHGLTAPFLRLAIVRHFKLHIIFVMDDRLTRWEDWLRKQAKESLSGSAVFAYRHKEE